MIIAIDTKGNITAHAAREDAHWRTRCGVIPYDTQPALGDEQVQCHRCLRLMARQVRS